jgi:hypothetical protein
VIIITLSAATAARAIVCSPAEILRSQVRYSGNLCFPTTLSMIILTGQGAAMLINVSTSIAIKMIARDSRYGAMSSRTKRAIFFDEIDPSVGGAVPIEVGFGDLIMMLSPYYNIPDETINL